MYRIQRGQQRHHDTVVYTRALNNNKAYARYTGGESRGNGVNISSLRPLKRMTLDLIKCTLHINVFPIPLLYSETSKAYAKIRTNV